MSAPDYNDPESRLRLRPVALLRVGRVFRRHHATMLRHMVALGVLMSAGIVALLVGLVIEQGLSWRLVGDIAPILGFLVVWNGMVLGMLRLSKWIDALDRRLNGD